MLIFRESGSVSYEEDEARKNSRVVEKGRYGWLSFFPPIYSGILLSYFLLFAIIFQGSSVTWTAVSAVIIRHLVLNLVTMTCELLTVTIDVEIVIPSIHFQ